MEPAPTISPAAAVVAGEVDVLGVDADDDFVGLGVFGVVDFYADHDRAS
jgi:hypothetical protein